MEDNSRKKAAFAAINDMLELNMDVPEELIAMLLNFSENKKKS